jgi:hypothetical protein
LLDLSNNIINRINDMLPVMVPFAIIAARIIGSKTLLQLKPVITEFY